jgi:hypothetical protein
VTPTISTRTKFKAYSQDIGLTFQIAKRKQKYVARSIEDIPTDFRNHGYAIAA